MQADKIHAHKITKPIQLLAAWLVGLSIVNITFLSAASTISSPSWIPALLAIAAVVNVPIFVVSVFLLQTRFRPEMQEDSYYSDYLHRQVSVRSDGLESGQEIDQKIEKQIDQLSKQIAELAESSPKDLEEKVRVLISGERVEELVEVYGESRTLSELYVRPEGWKNVVKNWSGSPSFEKDIWSLVSAGLVFADEDSVENAKLTSLGFQVASRAEEMSCLFSQQKKAFFSGEGSNNSRKADA
ncbi:hypothetical protein FF32_13175 [Halomonas campaniensis]|nr:hypothetical protein FF32_13175 [Halomonas campaniensis]